MYRIQEHSIVTPLFRPCGNTDIAERDIYECFQTHLFNLMRDDSYIRLPHFESWRRAVYFHYTDYPSLDPHLGFHEYRYKIKGPRTDRNSVIVSDLHKVLLKATEAEELKRWIDLQNETFMAHPRKHVMELLIPSSLYTTNSYEPEYVENHFPSGFPKPFVYNYLVFPLSFKPDEVVCVFPDKNVARATPFIPREL